ncbi:MAG: DMT family transporter [Elusimicrobiota bacterium]|nr:DMT family transporter [Elusimicrobiota bacterium]
MNFISPVQALWISVFVTSVYPVAGKFAVGIISPSLLMISATAAAVLFFAPWLTKNKMWGRYFKKDVFFSFCMIGLFGTALPYLCFFIALKYTTPANAAILNQIEVVYSLILTSIFLRERPSPKQLSGTTFVICGVLLILFANNFSIMWRGDLIILCSVWMFQASHIFAKKLPKNLPPQFISAGRAMFACVWSAPSALVLSNFDFDVLTFNFGWKLFLIVLYMGVVNYAAGNACWYKAIRNMDLSKATGVILCYPAITYIISAFSGFDGFNFKQIAGLILAFFGAYLITNIIKRKKNEISIV